MILPIASWVAIYFVIWWIALFAALPFAGRSQAEEGAVVPGSEASAPARFRWRRLVLLNTVISTAVFLLVMWLLTQKMFSLDDVPFLPKYGVF
ncbi:hypothetical protein GCM10008171_15400 [Methylopila jiangsuensis]|uniref:DUF1467 family protein n=1 Tax=Methylopila jiangsuensis TaxID=586230 RepID=A0A9W6N3I3_9HYPH|nr:DUF1467 family protein [Methylopila jiangsuensis]MDR6284196.1 putative secreted protein [Methylopila jiangsuensis]GLK76286.1 hypothetical protein GCM10008171_15400 [Methylopila jiangsuensis]